MNYLSIKDILKFITKNFENPWIISSSSHYYFLDDKIIRRQHYLPEGYTLLTHNEFRKQIMKQEKEFVLPKKWAVKRDEYTTRVINQYFNSLNKSYKYRWQPSGTNYDYIHSEPVHFKSNCCPHITSFAGERSLKEGFTVITFEQFKKYVMKETPIMETSRFPFNLSYEYAKKIIDAACDSWKTKLSREWGPSLLVKGYTEISGDLYKEMRKACTTEQHKLFDEIFGKDIEEINLTERKGIGNIKLFSDDNTKAALIEIRRYCEYKDKGFYLNGNFNWELEIDSEGAHVLIPTKK
jgi:hypothetical protein